MDRGGEGGEAKKKKERKIGGNEKKGNPKKTTKPVSIRLFIDMVVQNIERFFVVRVWLDD